MAMKAQVALEYLYTYGWVMVVLVIAIGALVGSGIFNPTAYGKDYCVGPTQIKCISVFSSNEGNVYLTLQNDFGFDIIINNIKVVDDNDNSVNADPVYSSTLKNGQKSEFVFSSIPALKPSALNKVKLELEYKVKSDSIGPSSDPYTIKVNVYTRTQKQ